MLRPNRRAERRRPRLQIVHQQTDRQNVAAKIAFIIHFVVVLRQQRSTAAMTQASIGFGQYIVTAKSQHRVILQTRRKAASAIVLARSWIEAGYTHVQIADPLGKPIHPDGYRSVIMMGVKLYCEP